MLKKVSIILITFFLPPLLQAQTPIHPERLTIEDGLSQGFISSILQDSEGFLWIGTKNGLNRYDGEQFEVFIRNPADSYSISHDWVTFLLEAGDYLLAGTRKGGLNIFHKQRKRFYKIPATNPDLKFWPAMRINGVLIDALDQVWVLGGGAGQLVRLQLPQNFWERLPKEEHLLEEIEMMCIPDLKIESIFKGNDQFIYGRVFPNKLLKIDIHSGNWEWFDQQIPNENRIGFVSSYERGLLTFDQKESKVLFFENGNWQASTVDFDFNNLIYLKTEKQLWVDSGRALLMFDNWVPSRKAISRKDATVIISNDKYSYRYRQILKDQSGVIWIGTGGRGILKINPHLLKIKKYFEGISIYAPPFITKEGDIIVSHNQGGVLSHSDKIPRHPFGQKNLGRTWWHEDADGTLWTVSIKEGFIGIYKMDKNRQLQRKTILDCQNQWSYSVIKEQNTDHFWIACQGKLIQYNPSTNVWKSYDLQHLFHNNYTSYSLSKTANGHWWIGTSRGLVHGIPINKSPPSDVQGFDFELIEAKEGSIEGLLNNDVASLLTDPKDDHILWLGTKGGGLHRLDTRSMTFTYLNSKNGLPSDVIYGVLNDEAGNLWMSSNKGIIHYNPASGNIQNFTQADGMQSDEFNTWAYAKAANGEFLFGGINGLNVFHPDDLKENPTPPNILITALIVNNELVNIGDSTGLLEKAIEYTSEITLPFSQNSITLEFAALEFSAPLKNRYRYYLEGAEPEWAHEDIDNKAAYLSLAPGTYTFKVKATNGDGVWNDKATELKITILPPWYRTMLAYFIYTLFIGVVIWQFQKFRENRLRLKLQMEQKQKEAARLKELDGFKSRLYTNITHEFRTPLTVILGMSDQLESSFASIPPKLAKQKLSFIRRNGKNLLNLVNQMLDLSKVENNQLKVKYIQGDIVKYVRYITESFHSFANARNVLLKVECKVAEIMMDYDPEKFRQILSNLLSNAIKYTPSGGRITVHLGRSDLIATNAAAKKMLNIAIHDTGQGISPDNLPYIFDRFYQASDAITTNRGTGIGLALTKELVKLLKGDITVESTEGEGSVFKVRLPISNNAEIISLREKDLPALSHVASIPSSLQDDAVSPRQQDSLPHLLIIEDNPDVVEYLASCVEGQFQLSFAYNGKAGIDKALETTPDIIISDVMMPEQDGYEVCEILKNDERTSHIPVILLTAKADIDSRLTGLQHGADAYLSKPFHQQELLIILQNQLVLRKKLQTWFMQLSGQPSQEPIMAGSDKKVLEQNLKIENAFLQKIRTIIEKNISDTEMGMPQLIRQLGMSRSQIYKKVKALTGRSPSLYIRSIRLFHARQLLKTTDLNVSEVAYEVGFSSPVYFSDIYLEEFGIRPKETRK